MDIFLSILTHVQLTLTLVAIAFLGMLLHILSRLKVLIANKIPFSWKVWVVNNLINTMFSFIAMIILLLVFASMGQLNASLAFMTGYATDNLIKRLIETASSAAGIRTDMPPSQS